MVIIKIRRKENLMEISKYEITIKSIYLLFGKYYQSETGISVFSRKIQTT